MVAVHSNSMQHISTATTITVTFNQTITDANFEGFATSVNGSVVTATRDQLGDSYMSGDNYNTLLEVKCLTEDAASACQAIDYQIKCTKSVNVQGNGGNE